MHILPGVQRIFYRRLVFQQRLAVVPDHGRHKFRKLVMLSRFVAPSVSLILSALQIHNDAIVHPQDHYVWMAPVSTHALTLQYYGD